MCYPNDHPDRIPTMCISHASMHLDDDHSVVGNILLLKKTKIVSSCRAQQSNLINKSMSYRQCFIGDLCPIVQQNIAIVCRTTVITPQTWIDVTEMCGSSAPKLLIAGLLVRVAKKYSTMNKWTS